MCFSSVGLEGKGSSYSLKGNMKARPRSVTDTDGQVERQLKRGSATKLCEWNKRGKKKMWGWGDSRGKVFSEFSASRAKLFVVTSNSAFCLHFTKTLCTIPPPPSPNNSSAGISLQSLIWVLLQFFCSLQWHLFSVCLLGVPPSATLLSHLHSGYLTTNLPNNDGMNL